MDILSRSFADMLEKKVGELAKTLDEAEVAKTISDIVPEAISTLTLELQQTLIHNSAAMLTERRRLFKGFCNRNMKRWKPGFDLLETFIVICTEAGESFNKALRPKAAANSDVLFDIVVRHHARACHIAQEILCLLKCGFADGAHARWRALHEVAVTAMFIAKHGQECAERFYWHHVVESYKGMRQHKEYEHRLQEKGPSDEEIEACSQKYQGVVARFGKPFCDPYGWASLAFPNKKVTFADIEKDIELDHMRPYYKWASQNVHSGAKGINKKLGLCEATEDILLVGQSNSGMTDPAHATAISLAQITCALLALEPNLDRVLVMSIIGNLEEQIGQLFLKCDQKKRADNKGLQKERTNPCPLPP